MFYEMKTLSLKEGSKKGMECIDGETALAAVVEQKEIKLSMEGIFFGRI